MAREKVDLRSHLRPDDLLKTDGKSENNQKKPSSSRTDDPSPATFKDAKLYMSKNLIDFDSDLEPPQGVAQTDIQKGSSPQTDVGWATFDDATSKKTTTMPSTSSTNFLEGPMLQIADLTSAPQIRFSNAKSLSFAPSNRGNQLNQQNFSPVNTTQYSNTLLNRATSAPVHSQDIFAMSYRPVSSAWNWQPNPSVNMQYGQHRTHYPVGIVNTTQLAHPYPVNPVSLAGGPASAHASTRFPSLTSMQEALPNLGSTAVLSRAPVHQYMVQQHTVQVPNYTFPSGYEGTRGIAATASTYGLPPMDQRLAAQNLQVMNHGSLPRVGGNPFA
uniref:ADP-ribosylation factor GTPase-activating protein AGD14 n=2 Tax=Zea mays TaxID=4577 RepID=A0A804Q2E3_MAIZE